MAIKTPVPSQALLRSLRYHAPSTEAACIAIPQCRRSKLHTTPRQFDNNESETRKSFRGQLYESTAQRVIRQKEEAARYRNDDVSDFARNSAFAASIVGFLSLSYYVGSTRPWARNPNSTLPVEEAEKLRHDIRPHNLQGAWIDLCLLLWGGKC